MATSNMRIFLRLAVVVLAPGSALAQGAPGTNIVVDVGVTALSMRGDTAQVTYVLRNHPSSAERLGQFTVDAPSPVVRIFRPDPQGSWFTSVKHWTRPVALWAPLDVEILPGQESAPLVSEALGLPTIVTCWIEGYYPPPTDIPSDTLPLTDPLIENSVPDSTVGVEPFPSDLSAGNLLLRLRGLLDQACGTSLAWITSGTVCTSLGGKLDRANQAVSQGDTYTARTELESFLAELEAQHGPGLPVNDGAYWLLKVNAEYVLNRVGGTTLVEDSFTDPDGTDITVHVAETGHSWSAGVNAVKVFANAARLNAGSDLNNHRMAITSDVADDQFEIFTDYRRGSTDVPGDYARLEFLAGAGVNPPEDRVYVELSRVSPTAMSVRLVRTDGFSFAQSELLNSGIPLPTGGSIRIGATVAGLSVQVWQEPAGGGARTNVGSAVTLTADYRDGTHKRVAFNFIGAHAGGAGSPSIDNFTVHSP